MWCPETGLFTFLKPPHLFGQGQNQTVSENGKIKGFGKALATFLGCRNFFFFSKAKGWLDYRCLCLGTTLAVTMGLGEGQGRVGATGIQWIEACNAS